MCVGLALCWCWRNFTVLGWKLFIWRAFSWKKKKKDRLLVDDKPWKRKDLNFLLRPGECLLSSGGHKSLWRRSGNSSRCQHPRWSACWPMQESILICVSSRRRWELAWKIRRWWTPLSGTWGSTCWGTPPWQSSSWRACCLLWRTSPSGPSRGCAWWSWSCHPGRWRPSPLSPRPWRIRGSHSASAIRLDGGGLEEGHVQWWKPFWADLWEQVQSVPEAFWLRQVGPQVYQDNCQAPPQADGLGLLQLEGDGPPGVVEEGGDDEWAEVPQDPGWEAGVVHDLAWDNPLLAGWRAVSQVQDRLLLVPGEAQADWLAWQQPRPQPHWECLVLDEGAAQEIQGHHLQELQQDVTRLWVLKMDDSQYLSNLVDTMPRRLEDVIRREGNPTKY